jgi:hypothetical protein
MNIIKRGEMKTPKYFGTCHLCGTIAEYESWEVKEEGHQFNNHIQSVDKCPICGKCRIILVRG